MAGIPPSNPSLNRFRQIGKNEQVSLQEDSNDLTRQTGNLGEKVVRWFTGTNEVENNRATKAFFESLEEAYGKRAKDWAVEGHESRLTDGKPLSGYRIQQILARADSARLQDKNALGDLLDARTPILVDEALKRANLHIPNDVGNNWRTALETKIKEDIRDSEKFKNPGKLESSSFGHEFGGLVNELVNVKYRQAIEHIGRFEENRQKMLDKPEDRGPWKVVSREEQDRAVFSPICRQNFLSKCGEGNGRINNFDAYWEQRIVPLNTRAFESKYGETRTFSGYEDTLEKKNGNNGVYTAVTPMRYEGFAEFLRMDSGISRAGALDKVRDEKFHISVDPNNIGQAYEVLAPILVRKDCPIVYWKVGDIETLRKASEAARKKLEDFEKGEGVQYDGKALEKTYKNQTVKMNDLPDTDRAIVHRELRDKVADLQRVIEGCQFTLYPMDGEDSGKFIDLLDEIEQTLRGAGLTPPPTPGSDEGVTGFVSFRIGAKEVNGEKVRIDPNSEGYGEFRETFRDNPFYLGQGFNLVSTQINQLLDRVGNGGKVANAEVDALQEKINSMQLSDEHRGKLNQRLDGLRQGI
jgi:hypothetical protein